MADLIKMSDIEVIQHYFKTDEVTAQNLLDEGMDMDTLRGNINPFKADMVKEINNINAKFKKELGDAVSQLDLDLDLDPDPEL